MAPWEMRPQGARGRAESDGGPSIHQHSCWRCAGVAEWWAVPVDRWAPCPWALLGVGHGCGPCGEFISSVTSSSGAVPASGATGRAGETRSISALGAERRDSLLLIDAHGHRYLRQTSYRLLSCVRRAFEYCFVRASWALQSPNSPTAPTVPCARTICSSSAVSAINYYSANL